MPLLGTELPDPVEFGACGMMAATVAAEPSLSTQKLLLAKRS